MEVVAGLESFPITASVVHATPLPGPRDATHQI